VSLAVRPEFPGIEIRPRPRGSIDPSAPDWPICGNRVGLRDDLTRMSKIGKPVRVVRVQPFVPAPMVPREVPTLQPVG